jgi:predicted RNA-binding protein YlxR (DUF448 family)
MPERTCVGCRAVLDKGSMVRLTAVEGRLMPDLDGRSGGRGAYVCSEKCLKEACKRKDSFQRALKTRVEQPEPEAVWEMVRATGLKG